MAGTVTCSPAKFPAGGIFAITFAFTSDASGNADGSTAEKVCGLVRRVVTNPGATAPTDDWDLTITDADGVDILGAAGANRDTANSEQIVPSAPVAVNSILTINVSNAGNAKNGTVVIYVEIV